MEQMSISRRRLKEVRSLTQRKYRERLGEMLVEGRRSVEAAINAAAPVHEVLVTPEAHERMADRLHDVASIVHVISASDLDAISAVETSQGVVAVVGIEARSPDSLVAAKRVVALDGLQDPGNAGSLIRTAAWFGADAILTAPGTVDLYNPKVVRAAMGGLWDVNVVTVEDIPSELERLAASGFAIYAADLEGTSIAAWEPSTPSVLVFGSEAHGISERTAEHVQHRIVIPGTPRRKGAESLNVAVAAGILLYAWTAKAA